MPLIFANPAGLWALLSLPAIVFIHFLQERSRKVRASTLFLLERVQPLSVGGARLERLRHSVPLWMQLIAACLITWLLAEPRWIREDSRQTIVVVLDSSASMSAFKTQTRTLLATKFARWAHGVAHVDWHLIESDTRKPTLYAGGDLHALLDALGKWEPLLGTHRADDALIVARGLARRDNGIVAFVTDRKPDVPSDIAVLSAGEPIENVGFSGITISENGKWRALVKNYGSARAEREWWIDNERTMNQAASNTAQKTRLTLDAGQSIALEGTFAEGESKLLLHLTPDRFSLDDALPLIKPKPRLVRVDLQLSGAAGDVMKKMLAAIEGVEINSKDANLAITEIGTATDTDALQIAPAVDEATAFDAAFTVAESHALTRDLNWMSLLTHQPAGLTLTKNDEPLLWKGERTLALLRHSKNTSGRSIDRFMLNWDLQKSNAARVPALLVMLQRFIEQVRERSDDVWAENFETHQTMYQSRAQSAGLTLQSGDDKFVSDNHVPARPGFFKVMQGDKIKIEGAAHFADAREADFKDAQPLDTLEAMQREAALRHSEADPLTPLWLLALFCCIVIAWAWKAPPLPVKSEAALPAAV